MSAQPALSRDELLAHPNALDCTIYRAHPTDPDGEEQDMGDARVVITGAFVAPAEWDAKERDDYFDGIPEEAFFTALFSSEAAPESSAHFTVEADDYAAVTQADGSIAMYYVCERTEDGSYILLREEDEDDE